MNPNDITSAIAVLVGSVVLYIGLNRTRVTIEMRQRSIEAASAFWKEAVEANQHECEVAIKLHNQMIEVAALMPAIACGVVIERKDAHMSATELEQVKDFLSRNAWALPHLYNAWLSFKRVHFHAKPWIPGRMLMAVVGWIWMRFLVNRDGTLKYIRPAKDASKQVEEFVQLDTGKACDRLVGAH